MHPSLADSATFWAIACCCSGWATLQGCCRGSGQPVINRSNSSLGLSGAVQATHLCMAFCSQSRTEAGFAATTGGTLSLQRALSRSEPGCRPRRAQRSMAAAVWTCPLRPRCRCLPPTNRCCTAKPCSTCTAASWRLIARGRCCLAPVRPALLCPTALQRTQNSLPIEVVASHSSNHPYF